MFVMYLKTLHRNLAVSKEMGDHDEVERWKKRTNAIIFKYLKILHMGNGVDFAGLPPTGKAEAKVWDILKD